MSLQTNQALVWLPFAGTHRSGALLQSFWFVCLFALDKWYYALKFILSRFYTTKQSLKDGHWRASTRLTADS